MLPTKALLLKPLQASHSLTRMLEDIEPTELQLQFEKYADEGKQLLNYALCHSCVRITLQLNPFTRKNWEVGRHSIITVMVTMEPTDKSCCAFSFPSMSTNRFA